MKQNRRKSRKVVREKNDVITQATQIIVIDRPFTGRKLKKNGVVHF